MLDLCRMFQGLTHLCGILKKKKHDQYTFIPCMFRFPNSDHFMFSREFAFCLFINYAYVCTWMHVYKTTFEKKKTVLWGSVTWSVMENKTYKLKTSIIAELSRVHVINVILCSIISLLPPSSTPWETKLFL